MELQALKQKETAREMECKMLDVVIIGAGISGLTAAHILLKDAPELKIAVLEAKGMYQ